MMPPTLSHLIRVAVKERFLPHRSPKTRMGDSINERTFDKYVGGYVEYFYANDFEVDQQSVDCQWRRQLIS